MSIKINGTTVAGKYKGQIIQQANENISGIIKIATEDEINAGIDNTTAVTPLYLSKKQDKLTAGEGINIANNEISIQEDYITKTTITIRSWE